MTDKQIPDNEIDEIVRIFRDNNGARHGAVIGYKNLAIVTIRALDAVRSTKQITKDKIKVPKILTWIERCEKHPDHQSGMATNGMIQMRMLEEIEELRKELTKARRKISFMVRILKGKPKYKMEK